MSEEIAFPKNLREKFVKLEETDSYEFFVYDPDGKRKGEDE